MYKIGLIALILFLVGCSGLLPEYRDQNYNKVCIKPYLEVSCADGERWSGFIDNRTLSWGGNTTINLSRKCRVVIIQKAEGSSTQLSARIVGRDRTTAWVSTRAPYGIVQVEK